MRIRKKLLLSHLIVGIIPIILIFAIVSLVMKFQTDYQIKNNLISLCNEIHSKIDKEMEISRNYAFFFSRQLNNPDYHKIKYLDTYNLSMNINRYENINIIEFSYRNQILRRDFTKLEYDRFLTSEKLMDFMWNYMSMPLQNQDFKMSFPEVLNGYLVIRNCAIIYNFEKKEKIGLTIISVPIDAEYLKKFIDKLPDVTLFIETDKGITFSSESFNNQTENIIRNVKLNNKKTYDKIRNYDGKQYYVYKKLFYTLKGRPIAYLGILYGFESLNKTINLFYKIGILIFILSFIVAFGIAIIFSGNITKPILFLKDLTSEFHQKFEPIPAPLEIKDEVMELQKAFSDMSMKIIEYKTKMENYNKELQNEIERKNRELRIAQKIQNSIIPAVLPRNVKINFAGKYIPMEELGGDYYDVFPINDDKITVLVADVSGHGVPSALITTMAKVLFNSNAKEDKLPDEVVSIVNKEIYNILYSETNENDLLTFYLTCFYGYLDLKNKILLYTNAGHNPILIIKSNKKVLFLNSNSFVIGASPNSIYKTDKINIDIGDKIILYTDGITEARDEKGEFLGEERFINFLLENYHLDAKTLADKTLEEILKFKKGVKANDDMTLLIADIMGEEKEILKVDMEVSKLS